jgi:signal transduction histidine kinase
VFPESLSKAQNFPEFALSNWIYIGVTPIFYGLSFILIAQFEKKQKVTNALTFYILAFTIYIVFAGMFSSFIATADPRNALTLYLIALILTSILFVFEYDETILLIVITECLFTFLLYYSQADATEMLYDQLISMILLSGFYLISRYFFSYKAGYYMQLLEIREKNNEIEKASGFKTQVLGMVAHDLRNPIAAVESLAMMMEMDTDDEETQENLQMMKESCARARSIIDDLLDAARNENFDNLELERTELNKFLNTLINQWQIQIKDKNEIVLISYVNNLYANINVKRFQRAIDNLVGNALKFSKEHDRIDIYLNQQNNKVTIEVKDYGLGIPQKMIPFLFDRFSKAGRPGLKGEQSTGLGLSIVKQIIEGHRGAIEVSSEEGKGSSFLISLPKA